MKQLKSIFFDHRTDLPQWITSRIGQIMVEWSVLERELEQVIQMLMNTDIGIARIVTSRMNARKRISIIGYLIEWYVYHGRLKPTFLKQFAKLGERVATKTQNKRDMVAHGLWSRIDGKWWVLRLAGQRPTPELKPELEKLSRAFFPQREHITKDKLDEIVQQIISDARDGGGGDRGGGGGGGPSMMSHGPSGPSNFSSMSRGPSGPSNMSPGPSGRSNFAQGPQGRTLYNQEHGNRDIRGDQRGQYGRLDRDDLRHGRNLYNRQGDVDRGKFDRDNRIGRDVERDHGRIDRDRDHGADFRHRGIVRGDFFEHRRHFHFRRFWHNEWVFLNDWDDCTAWAWVHVAPGIWSWRPIDICIG